MNRREFHTFYALFVCYALGLHLHSVRLTRDGDTWGGDGVEMMKIP